LAQARRYAFWLKPALAARRQKIELLAENPADQLTTDR
jgi:hypothetical protein